MIKITAKNILYLVLYALPNTVLSFGIIYIINNALGGAEGFLKDYMGFVFVAIVIYTYLLNIIFQKHLNQFSFKLLYENEKMIFRKILQAPLIKLEQLGSQRFYTAVEDLRTFAFLPYTVTHTVNSILMLLLCLVYMFTLSVVAAIIVILLIIAVAACYFIVMNSMAKEVGILRVYNEDYYNYVDDVMKGFKELKLGHFRRTNIMNRFLIPNRDAAGALDFQVNYVFLSINLISQYGLYFVIGIILFAMPEWGLLNRADVIAYVVIILFISGPINNLINLQQIYTRFLVAVRRIKTFMKDFEIEQEETIDGVDEMAEFESLEFKNVLFNYKNEIEDNNFTLGPINLKIAKGETIFVIGGNGSGKSTFINLLTGLYKPSAGDIVLNEKETGNSEENIKELIAAVFTNNHIFSHNYENFTVENNSVYQELLQTMQMDKVVVELTEAAARNKFSKGQSKRMSLIFALLEKKPILVLDEWAADQDPHFRKYFYETLIPMFREAGKTIIAVTHDDAYFHQADRIIKFDYGKIAKDVNVANELKLNETLWT